MHTHLYFNCLHALRVPNQRLHCCIQSNVITITSISIYVGQREKGKGAHTFMFQLPTCLEGT